MKKEEEEEQKEKSGIRSVRTEASVTASQIGLAFPARVSQNANSCAFKLFLLSSCGGAIKYSFPKRCLTIHTSVVIHSVNRATERRYCTSVASHLHSAYSHGSGGALVIEQNAFVAAEGSQWIIYLGDDRVSLIYKGRQSSQILPASRYQSMCQQVQ